MNGPEGYRLLWRLWLWLWLWLWLRLRRLHGSHHHRLLRLLRLL